MTRLIEAEVEGLAGFPGTHQIEFDARLSVFWGLNGRGKTSLLKILVAALDDDAGVVGDVAFAYARVRFFSENYNAVLERTLWGEGSKSRSSKPRRVFLPNDFAQDDDLLNLEENHSRWETTVLQGDADIPHKFRRYKHSYLPISRLNELQIKKNHRLGGVPSVDVSDFDFEEDIAMAWRQYNSVSLVSIREIQQKGLADILSVLFQSSVPTEELEAPELEAERAHKLVQDFLVQQRMQLDLDLSVFASRYRRQHELRHVVQRIQNVNLEIEEATRSQKAFQEIIERLYSGDKKITFSRYSTIEIDAGGRRKISVDRLSSGEKQLLRILLTTLGAGTSPVIIDEPELSMHIDWQIELISCMREINPQCQIILATHSPEIIGRVPTNQVFEL